ncbi:MAG: hypothetical protein J6U37_03530 [Lachnospiraceae bacterium]|nr:hypothetical protein [Lachnospiraceae bacterium]
MGKINLNSNAIKFIALISMTIDHVGLMLFPDMMMLRYIGRLAFPIFAYMIAEGCFYTRNKKKHFLMIFGLGVLCQFVYYFALNSLNQGILIAFSLSVLTIYSIDFAFIKREQYIRLLLPAGMLILDAFLCLYLPTLLPHTDYAVDYGIVGVLLPVLIYLGKEKVQKLAFTCLGIILLSLEMGPWEWYALLALIPLALYNGEKGKLNTKYLFYVYYPLHLAVIYGLSLLF